MYHFMSMSKVKYLAGVCNIGPVEIARRRKLGLFSFVISIAVLVILIWLHVNPWWRLIVFFPVFMSASGFLQAYFRFCPGFARAGVYNFTLIIGKFTKVSDDYSKEKDKSVGNKIMLYAISIGLVASIIGVMI
jgi:hypothetical protein